MKFRLIILLVLLASAPLALAQEQEQPPQQPQPVPQRDDTAARADLQQAYQKEYAFLSAQLRELRQRSTGFEQSAGSDISSVEGDISRLENELLGLQTRAESLEELLIEGQRQLDAIEDNKGLLDATFQQADASLEQYGVEEFGDEAFLQLDEVSKIQQLFDRSLSLLGDFSAVRREQGAFFLQDGREVNGDILKVGNIAAYGVSPDGGGVLAPAGEGRFKLWNADAGEAAQAMVAGRRPDNVPIFLFESTAKAIEEKAGKTLLSIINSGGTIAWVIVGLGILGLILIILRILFLRSASASTDKIVKQVVQHVEAGDNNKALEACKRFKGSTSRVVAAAIRNLDRDREHIEDVISEAILHESAHLNRFGAFILVIAAVAPLLGLLGTVTGMISTFDIITEFGTGDPKLLSGGISIALVTTEIGLAVAIPTLLLGNLLSGWAEGIKDGMEKGALRVINTAFARRDGLSHEAYAV